MSNSPAADAKPSYIIGRQSSTILHTYDSF